MKNQLEAKGNEKVSAIEQRRRSALKVCNLALCANDRYFLGLYCVVFTSLRWLAEDYAAKVYVIDAGISLKNKKKLEALFTPNGNNKLCWLSSPEKFFANAKCANYHKSVLYRLALPELVHDADRIIYLDADVLVFSDLSRLWDLALRCPEPVLAVQDWEIANLSKASPEFVQAMGCLEAEGYFNSGVMVLNLRMLREEDFLRNAVSVFERHGDTAKFADQCVLNCLIAGRWRRLDNEWNVPAWSFDKQTENQLPAVCHFTNRAPWIKRRWSPSQTLFEMLTRQLDLNLEWRNRDLWLGALEAVAAWLLAPARAFRLYVRSIFCRDPEAKIEVLKLATYWWLFFSGGLRRILSYRRRISEINKLGSISSMSCEINTARLNVRKGGEGVHQ